ncbi:electron transfer flavo protein, alpha subunit [Tilletiaria anomala UBC 951]|uniref:Probable electron transfer flavoprotein subunit alpha n=1 Tax=Tilletiaria anomala (strain ATCC 24038 / CBS 436.72 / UBC 951) TaxID=1037660 RepID=A0A066VHY9_TILAU|nr:electron transfer flavo protein, alpha subunit [Tilletiaria anomala UBC 951]KDN39913.1 electron transfer flavo protein, alpha subunit [Tilletiaria anomala UBC 951]
MIATRSAISLGKLAIRSSGAATLGARSFSSSRSSLASTLLFVEHRKGEINPATLSALTAAQKLGGDVHAAVVGSESEVEGVADKVAKVNGISKVFYSASKPFEAHLPESLAPLLKSLLEKGSYSHLFAGHTAVGRDTIPRVAALVDSAQISDIIEVQGEDTFVRPIYAGNALATVKSSDKVKIITVRGTAFEAASTEGGSAEKEKIPAGSAEAPTEFVEEKLTVSARPDLGTASRVVSGGRALKSTENFAKYIEPLADALNAAVGASRAAVDAGYADNSLQVGQTGKIIAPELYVAVGISGAIQHLAGMKDSKTIVAINKDADAPIFQVADLGLVADLYDAVPELTEKIKK